MALSTLDLILVALYIGVVIAIGFFLSKKAGQNLTEYFLSGRKTPWYLAGISMVATTFAVDTPLAVTELVHQEGIAGNWLWWNFLIGGMLTVFFFSKLWRRSGVLTELEFTELRYSGKRAKFLRVFRAIYLGLFMNILIMGWVSLAFLSILEILFGLSSGEALLFLGLTLLLIGFYSILSGLKGIMVNDALQFVIAMTGCIVLAVYVLNTPEVGGISGIKSKLPEEATSFFPDIALNSAMENGRALTLGIGSFLAYLGLQWWMAWYPGSEPGGGGYIAQRMMSTPDEKSSFWATFTFQIAHFCIRPWPWIIVALAVPILYPDLTEENAREGFVMAMTDFLPSGWLGLMFVAFLAAYMSTISTHLNWGASYLVHDVAKRFYPDAQVNWVAFSRLVTLGLLILAFIAASVFETITGVWFFVIEASAGIGAVLIFRWYCWRINAWSEITATIAPLVFSVIFKIFLNYEFPDSFFLIIACTTVSWLIVTLLTPPEPEQHLKSFVQKVKPAGNWKNLYQKADMAYPYSRFHLLKLTGGWLSAVICAYSFLFGMGSFILLEPLQGLAYTVAFLASLGILICLIKFLRMLD